MEIKITDARTLLYMDSICERETESLVPLKILQYIKETFPLLTI